MQERRDGIAAQSFGCRADALEYMGITAVGALVPITPLVSELFKRKKKVEAQCVVRPHPTHPQVHIANGWGKGTWEETHSNSSNRSSRSSIVEL
jgi:hypothetical protein